MPSIWVISTKKQGNVEKFGLTCDKHFDRLQLIGDLKAQYVYSRLLRAHIDRAVWFRQTAGCPSRRSRCCTCNLTFHGQG